METTSLTDLIDTKIKADRVLKATIVMTLIDTKVVATILMTSIDTKVVATIVTDLITTKIKVDLVVMVATSAHTVVMATTLRIASVIPKP